MKIKSFYRLAFLALIILSALCGCSYPAMYSVNMSYDASGAVVPTYLKPDAKALQSIVAVAEFTDVRKVDDPLVIGRVIEKNGMKVLVMPKTIRPTMAAAQGARSYLRNAGYNVSGVIERWDLKEENIPQVKNSKILIGGAIEGMEITCKKSFPTNTYTTKVRLAIYVADIPGKKFLHKTTVESEANLEFAFFSEERMGDQLGVALGDAIERIFEKREIAQAIKDALSQ